MNLSYELGFRLPSSDTVALQNQISLAQSADEAGYDAVFASETWGYDAFTRLGYLAATVEAKLGTAIIPVHSRTPALIGQSIATLSELANRHTVLGLGLSSPDVIENWYGVPFEPALRRQRETIEIVRAVLEGNPVKYDGQLFELSFDAVRFDPQSDTSLFVAAQGETNITLTGEFADGWFPSYIPMSSLRRGSDPLIRGAERQNRDPEEVDIMPFVSTCILEDGEQARRRCRETIAYYIGAMGDYHRNALASHGYSDVAKRIYDYWEAENYSASRESVTDDLLTDVALAGTPEHARKWFAARENEIDGLVTVPSTRASESEIIETINHIDNILD